MTLAEDQPKQEADMTDEIITKVCFTCKTPKPLSAFSKNSRKIDGLDYRCKMCVQKDARERRIPRSAPLTLASKDIARFWSKVDKTPGQGPNEDCWHWLGAPNRHGYGRLGLGGYREVVATRIAYLIAYGIDAYPLNVLHRCDNPPCVRPDHLFLGDQLDNMRDCKEKGRIASGARQNAWKMRHVKLTPETARYARALKDAKVPAKKIAAELGISVHHVYKIKEYWRWLDPIDPPPSQ